MVCMLASLCVSLALSFDLIAVSGSFDLGVPQIDIDTRLSTLALPVPANGAIISAALLLLLCVLMPMVPLLFALVTWAATLAVITTIQFIALPFQWPAFSVIAVSAAALLLAYLVVSGVAALWRLWRANRYLKKYAPPQIVDHYLQHASQTPGGESRDMTIMFCDIKRFTGISERLDPELLPGWLNRFFDVVCEIVARHGGTIDKYIGDSVMAFWGAPDKSDSHASDALRAAREIIPAVEALSRELVKENLPPIAVGIGLSTGSAHVGHLGSKERMTYTVVGDAVNTADRLQRCTGVYDLSLVVNDRMTEQVPDFLFRELDTVHVKGRQRFVRIFQPICHEDDALPDTYRRLQMHRKAMQFYRRGMWTDAEKLFRALGEHATENAFYSRYVERLVNIRQSEPSDDPTFVIDFTQKIG
ncbi:MAG: adenylate/guanylate cyclase domain-containing protein [Pseudomonadota bacterium]